MEKPNIKTLLADYGNLRYCMGRNISEPHEEYEKTLIGMGEKYGIEYDYKEDVQFYSGIDPIDKTYYLECKLLEHISKFIFKIAEKGENINCEDCIACKQVDDEYNYCEFYSDYFEKKDKKNICFSFEGE